MRKLSAQNLESVLDTIHLALETASFPAFKRLINDYGHAFLSAPDKALTKRYLAMVDEAAPGVAYEEAHGRFSLLNLDHPFNRLLVSQGVLRPDEDIVLAAKARSRA